MTTYTIKVESKDGIDIETTTNPAYAVEVIAELTWRDGYKVTFTGDPFADVEA